MKWTLSQRDVIDARGSNLLVSAAAGSGKTAVLVERIIQLICDESHPVDIDHLLVMTFTNAAAAEMRERIAFAIERRLEEEPEREHLQIQAALVHRAKITTIDSFCLSLIRDHFNLLDLDPGFRIGDEGELKLLRADVMEAMLEEYYQADDPIFQEFVETYATGKSDKGIEDYIFQVDTFSQSTPFPGEWLNRCRKELCGLEDGKLESSPWIHFLIRDVKTQLSELSNQLESAMEVCRQEGGPEKYLPTLNEELGMIRELLEARDYGSLQDGLGNVSFARIPAARGKDLDPEKKEYAGQCRNRVKKALTDLKEMYGGQTMEEAAADMLGSRDVLLKLLELAETFHSRYQEAKKEKNIVDFNDLEHEALRILVRREEGRNVYTSVADEIAGQFAEILVDEYQDSNDVQETLIQSLSSKRFGRPNVFMVGDVKQSIYKFRLARPELFMRKYESYKDYETSGGEAALGRKIELRQNFRSRSTVLEGINDVFFQIMTKNLGNIQYTDKVALHPGAVFEGEAGLTELLMTDTGAKAAGPADEELEDYTSREMEARMIAARIRQLTDQETGFQVWDKEKNCLRRAGYGDIVILLRTLSGWTESFLNVLTREDIPAFAYTGTGYFDTMEVETILSMLAVIDNPMQDIPLAVVLKSPIVSMSEEELAWMAAVEKKNPKKGQDRGLYGAVRLVLSEEERWERGGTQGKEEVREERETKEEPAAGEIWQNLADAAGVPQAVSGEIRKKVSRFWTLLGKLRREASYVPIHELIHRMYLETGYYDYVSAMPAGEVRRANLDMLIEKAWAYEKTSYKGLFHFIRYIEKLKKYDTDFGEATAAGKSGEMVRIMSIHKSKGLEFPIVFLAGMGKPFNRQDVRSRLLIDSDLGLAADYFNVETRVRTPTIKKHVLKRKMDLDNLGEELRVLYVAMTRAKEKLIMTATDRHLEKKLEKWRRKTWNSRQIPYTVLATAGCFLDWLLMAGLKNRDLFVVKEIRVDELVGEAVERTIERIITGEELKNQDLTKAFDPDLAKTLARQLSYEYPYRADIDLHTKMSVSQLKKAGQDTDDKNSLFQPVIPEFLKEKPGEEKEGQRPGGAAGGSAYHRVLELLDFTAMKEESDVRRWLERAVREGRILEETRSMVKSETIWRFLRTPLGERMRKAQEENRLHREQQFVMGIPAREMGLGDSDELVLIQGIIDAWMEEGEEIILIDYKTDHIGRGQEEVLANRYRAQLDYYRRALEKMKKKPVRECIIYSLALQKPICLKL